MADFDRESMLEMFIFEMVQLTEQLEQTIVQSETGYNSEQINEIFRIMHTIKGSAAMMLFNGIAGVAHLIEDLFFNIREKNPKNVDYPRLTDLVLEGADFIKAELAKIQLGQNPDGNAEAVSEHIKVFLKNLMEPGNAEKTAPKAEAAKVEEAPVVAERKLHSYKAKILFDEGCEMENIRAYTLIHNMQDIASDIHHTPEDIIEEEAADVIRKSGFFIDFTSDLPFNDIQDHLMKTIYLRELKLDELLPQEHTISEPPAQAANTEKAAQPGVSEQKDREEVGAESKNLMSSNPSPDDDLLQSKRAAAPVQHVISVNVNKLDALLNLMGELVISEAMVTQNSDLEGLQLDSFSRETRQLRKIINNLQETVMSMRMVPLSNTFLKMHRIVRDMCRQLDKVVRLEILGEETEVDKNIIEHISDPIMHIIRNSVDHGIEMPSERIKLGKPEEGKVVLQAKRSGSDVLIIIKDDGAGLNREKIMQKAKDNGLLRKPESEYTDKEIHQFIFMPGFSTNAEVTAFSGRGVGMDVVVNDLEMVGGTASVESTPGEGTVFTLKIPLTLAIVEGMTILMAGAKYTIPIASIKRSFKPKQEDVFRDPDGNEMITDRGEIYNVVRLYEFFGIEGAQTDIENGILIQLENNDQFICLLADDLLGEQRAVVQSMPKYFKKVRGLSGCTLLGNGDISLIIDVAGFFDK